MNQILIIFFLSLPPSKVPTLFCFNKKFNKNYCFIIIQSNTKDATESLIIGNVEIVGNAGIVGNVDHIWFCQSVPQSLKQCKQCKLKALFAVISKR